MVNFHPVVIIAAHNKLNNFIVDESSVFIKICQTDLVVTYLWD